ncbi:hypothetical protein Tsubulata_018303 [Turnera subulata]|uniref:MSP domain-containing protein n=1 Tax=Turnera subulata TaxID=218843 RepID=A0A9Q0G6W2_9ROSI|nr:hypothetical protein Tsubulata_018303 [Turnera subulata]
MSLLRIWKIGDSLYCYGVTTTTTTTTGLASQFRFLTSRRGRDVVSVMATTLLDIHPLELKLTFELKKQSSCSVQLINKSDHYVAFKVKTTSPTKYCVRPNLGVIMPKGTCDFTVIMQAQKVAPANLHCKDKFLVQSTTVALGTTEEDITSHMFSRQSGEHIEERKLRVILVSPSHSQVLLPNNVELKKDPSHDASLLRDVNEKGIENIPPLDKDVLGSETAKNCNDLRSAKDAESRPPDELNFSEDTAESKLVQEVEELKSKLHADHAIKKLTDETRMNTEQKNELKRETLHEDVFHSKMERDVNELRPVKCEESRPPAQTGELISAKGTAESRLVGELEELKSNLLEMNFKLRKADHTIMKLTEERRMATKQMDMLKHDIEVLRKKDTVKRIQVGFPLLYVFMVSLISLAFGYLIHQ